MKKIITITLATLIAVFSLIGCGTKNEQIIRVNEVTDSFFYAPFYLAIEKGFFKEEGIEIELTNGGGSDVSMTALLSKSADIILAGPETVVYVARQQKQDAPKVFAQLTKRDGCFLISRQEEPNFSWDNLRGKEIIIGRKGGLPAMTFEYIIKNRGYSSNDLTLRTDVQFNLMGPTFDSGVGDYVTLFEPTATEFVSAGKGHIVACVGKESGEVPYTSFIALSSYLEENSEKIEKFVRALYKANTFIVENDEKTVAEYLVKHFTNSQVDGVAESLKNYKNVDTWGNSMCLTEDMFNRLIAIIENAGEDVGEVKYSDVVDNTFAQKEFEKINK